MMAKKISATMAVALAEMHDHGGELVRWQGGFWTYPGCAVKGQSWPTGENIPMWYVSAGTVNALIDRKEIEVAERHQGGWVTRVRLANGHQQGTQEK